MSESRTNAGELFRAHAPFVAGFLMRLGARDVDVDDLVQEVFLIAHRRGGFTPGEAKPTTWLAEIAVRVCSNHRRTLRRKPAEPQADPGARLTSGADPERAADAGRALARVQRCLDDLDLDHRAVFVLYELEGESCDAIANALSVPIGTVYRRLHTARNRFRAAYERLSKEPRHGA